MIIDPNWKPGAMSTNAPSPDLIETAKRLVELSEKATAGPWDVWPERIGGRNDAISELADQVRATEPLADHLYLLNAGGKCPASTGCGPTSEANAEFIKFARNHAPALARDYLALRDQLAEATADLAEARKQFEYGTTDILARAERAEALVVTLAVALESMVQEREKDGHAHSGVALIAMDKARETLSAPEVKALVAAHRERTNA